MLKLLSLINGWKTYSGAAVMFLTGTTQVITALSGDGGTVMDGIALISAAIMGTGVKHAVSKAGA